MRKHHLNAEGIRGEFKSAKSSLGCILDVILSCSIESMDLIHA